MRKLAPLLISIAVLATFGSVVIGFLLGDLLPPWGAAILLVILCGAYVVRWRRSRRTGELTDGGAAAPLRDAEQGHQGEEEHAIDRGQG